jgi:hypothetical protein
MKNYEVFSKNPYKRKLVNEGVANVNDEKTDKSMEVLKYELETFVCEGQYKKGMKQILESYLKNLDEAVQPAVWVSGFFGSGKSHLVKMLRALWKNEPFNDGSTPRGIAHLPSSVTDLLKELDTEGKRRGGIHAVSGTLGSGSDQSVRLSLLGIIFKSVGLPEKYNLAHFVMDLKRKNIYHDVLKELDKGGYDWKEELFNLHVSEGIPKSLVKLKPDAYSTVETCKKLLLNAFPDKTNVTNDEMLKSIEKAISINGDLPLTLLVLDEVQQYIGESSDRSNQIQEVVESCTKHIGGKLLFVGTGQTAITGTANLQKLKGRFIITIELSDADVDKVIRKVILAKKPESRSKIEKIMNDNIGEIAKHLTGTSIQHNPDDKNNFVQDYPMLPVRRRFWERALRVLDSTGTDSQIRSQLRLVYEAIKENGEKPLGYVVPGDFLLFHLIDSLIQTSTIPQKAYKFIKEQNKDKPQEYLKARACALIYLINKIAGSNKEIGLRADVNTLADLMVENINVGSASLRKQLLYLLEN